MSKESFITQEEYNEVENFLVSLAIMEFGISELFQLLYNLIIFKHDTYTH